MPTARPLAGLRVVVTRPRAQAEALAARIAALGGRPWIFPLLEILPPADPAPLAAAAARLEHFDFAVFVSPNAVQHALPVLCAGRAWPVGVQVVAVGPATVQALAAAGVGPCLAPSGRFDSESLLALPELAPARVAGKKVLILRGNGGRELLGDTLAARGAQVLRIACYQRRGPDAGGRAAFLAGLVEGCFDALLLSSSEALAHLLAGVPEAERPRLLQLPIFVPHARIAQLAGQAGFSRVMCTAPADDGVLAGLCAYNFATHTPLDAKN
jgi:uroporphyrinogen-III synthase